MIVAALVAGLSLLFQAAPPADDPLTRPIPPNNPDWLKPQTPVRVYGNTYFVGTATLSLVLIDTGDGLILIDGALPQTVGMIEGNIRRLGFRVEDIRYILNTEAHFDHSGGIAALARDSGAQVIASPAGAEALRAGRVLHEDPQASGLPDMPAAANARGLAEGETLTLGAVTVRMIPTPGHTPGSASWTWTSCEGEACGTVVFASSLNAVAADPFTYTGHPEVTATLRASIDRVDHLACDVLISAHPEVSGGDRKLAAVEAGATTPNPFLDPDACHAYAQRARDGLAARLAREAGTAP